MRSSTSSSDLAAAVPDVKFGRMWLTTVVLAGLMLGGLEIAARRAGHRPNVTDSAALWAMHRRALDADDTSRTIAIIGNSRSQLGLVPGVIEQALPDAEVVHLSVNGTSCLPTLYDVAERSGFRGTLICDFVASLVEPRPPDRQAEWIEHYHRMARHGRWINMAVDQSVRSWLQGRLVIAGISPVKLCDSAIVHRALPRSRYLHMDESRYLRADYQAFGETWLIEHRARRVARSTAEHGAPPEELRRRWRSMLGNLRAAADRIEQRGGRVIFLRMPSSGRVWEHDQARYRRAEFFDELEAAGLTTVHFQDHPALARFECPDASHLNWNDAEAFTRSLVGLMVGGKMLAYTPADPNIDPPSPSPTFAVSAADAPLPGER